MRRAVGCHVFAGGFTGGVKDHFDVTCQLEHHGLGVKTAEEVWQTPVVLSRPEEWPAYSCDLLYGNPRCTAFSSLTGGCGAETHGPWARQCEDIHDLVTYSLAHDVPVTVWESVQQAYTTGHELIKYLEELFIAKGRRIAHLFVNAQTFGNSQCRKRYFFVAYPAHLAFNLEMPVISPYYPVTWDAISHRRDRTTREWPGGDDCDYDEDCYGYLNDDNRAITPMLPTGWSMNAFAEFMTHKLPPRSKNKWELRTSKLPFSLHTIYRVPWMRPCPTLKSSSSKLIHPWHHRPFTIGELADVMGWRGKVPVGPRPVFQLAKGVCPDVGSWLAQMALRCLDDSWGGDDWESSCDTKTGQFVGRDTHGEPVKVCDVTEYYGHSFDQWRYPDDARLQIHRHNVDRDASRPLPRRLLGEFA